ncbi:hypothetical protein [Pseudoxanthomonas sp. SE1]|uniref:hypothetical protein n=1 Tax=Pseudoxanthomonas sp. SE1 TaxID=1664560 RepID=UPI00240D4D0D|nr:hypothetical protein [Pseudoxanthomonas sp. SE1]WFC43180.1 hypothetical protein OY559_06635 [Pseudoxanthomonas sp. SE1]
MGVPYTTAELIAQHKASLMDSAGLFVAPNDADFLRHLRIAGRAVGVRKRPRTHAGQLQLEAGQVAYPAPADLIQVKGSPWGVQELQTAPWNMPRGPLPTLRLVAAGTAQELHLSPPPNAAQIAAFGAVFPFYYFAAHTLPDDPGEATSVTDIELDLVLLRAKAEAMRELTIRNHSKPITLRAGQGGESQPKNMTAAALYQAFLDEFNKAE